MSDGGRTTREALLDAAERLFGERGYAAVGIREIVDHADANIAAINYHFGSKSALYRETVRRAMGRRAAANAWAAFDPVPATPAAAAAALARFIELFLFSLVHPTDPVSDMASRLIMREAMQPSEAIDFVIRDFIGPHESILMQVMHVLVPAADRAELAMLSHSVLGQVLHYRAHRPLLERIAIGDWLDESGSRRIAAHIVRFTLRGVRCPEHLIEAALRRTGNEPGSPAAAGAGERRSVACHDA